MHVTQRPLNPIDSVFDFAETFGPGHIALAMHAALPLGLTPDMLHLLRANFLARDSWKVSWIAEADLLLSPLCKRIGDEMYQMPSEIRSFLVDQFRQEVTFPSGRIFQVAQYLAAYTSFKLAQVRGNREASEFYRMVHWSALAFISPENAARALALAFYQEFKSGAPDNHQTAGLLGLTEVVDDLSLQLLGQDDLLLYATMVNSIILQHDDEAERLVDALDTGNTATSVAGVALPSATHLVNRIGSSELSVRRRLRQVAHENDATESSSAISAESKLHHDVFTSDTDPDYPNNETRYDLKLSPLTAMEAASHFPRLVVLGDPGSGMSTFVNFLALCLSGQLLDPQSGWLERLRNQGWEHKALLPVHVTLRDFAQDMGLKDIHGTAQSLLDHIGRMLEWSGCGGEIGTLKSVLSSGDALVILDGLDEVSVEWRDAVRNAISALMATYPCRVLITCRILSYANPEWQISGTETVILAPFDEGKIRHFIQAWYTASQSLGSIDPEVAEARIADLTGAVEDIRLRDIATNPMLLTVMAIVHNHRGTLPREMVRLYHACVEILMFKWKPEAARHLREVLELPDENDLYRILWQIAYEAQERQGDRVGAADISKREVMTIAADDHLGGNYAKAQAFCDYIEDRAGLLIGRGGVDDTRRVYAFPHRTFQEFLAGCYIADDMHYLEIFAEKARAGTNWREVLLLATGHMLFNKLDRNAPIMAAQVLLIDDPASDQDWQADWLAGEMILLVGLPTLQTHPLGRTVLVLARERLTVLVSEGHLEPIERAAAGCTLAELGDPRPGVGLREDGLPDFDWVEIPAGEFIYQNNERMTLPTFHMARYPVTIAQFQAFLDSPDGFRNPAWWEGLEVDEEHRNTFSSQVTKLQNHPCECVSWYDAMAYCHWISEQLGYEITLPTEQQWEKAARGMDGREYPYGSEFDVAKGNTAETGIGMRSGVGIFPGGASPYGVLDMSGNLWEWCINMPDGSVDLSSSGERVLRGGSWGDTQAYARCVTRRRDAPVFRYDLRGFRVICFIPK